MKHSLNDHSGYLIIDHSSSPGIKEEDIPLELKGKVTAVPEGQILERDIQQCTHCQREIILNPSRTRAREKCPYCYHYICDSCYELLRKTGTCIPFKKVLDEAETLIARGIEPLIKLT